MYQLPKISEGTGKDRKYHKGWNGESFRRIKELSKKAGRRPTQRKLQMDTFKAATRGIIPRGIGCATSRLSPECVLCTGGWHNRLPGDEPAPFATVHLLCTIHGKAGASNGKSDPRLTPSFQTPATTYQPLLESALRPDLIRNHQVGGSSPPAGSNEINGL